MILLFTSVNAEAYSPLNFFTDRNPPDISIGIMSSHSYSGTINVQFEITDEATSIKDVHVYLDGADITKRVHFASHKMKNSVLINTEGITEGRHVLSVAAVDSSLSRNRTIEDVEFFADNTPPLLKLGTGAGLFKQGKTAILYLTASEPSVEITGTFQGKEIRAYPYKGRYRLLLGFSIDDPGNMNYPMKLKATDQAGNSSDYHYTVYVGNTKFPVLSFTLKPTKAGMLMPDNIREDWKHIEDIVVEENDRDFIRGRFIKPTNGHVSMAFGVQEFINGEESGKHRGLDFANRMGAPVWASNDGLVRLAQHLPAHGNCVVLEHGEGIFTYYAHLSKILVKPGDFVKKGENVGLVGMTGVATGPHLHFAMNVHNLRVDPEQWLEGVVKD